MITSSKFQGEVRDLNTKGYGVVDHPEGMVFFVRGTWPGDCGTFEVESVEKRYGFAKLVELQKPSPSRVDPPCPHLGFDLKKCGGCSWMIAEYGSQLEFKKQFLIHQLDRAKVAFSEATVLPILASQTLGYRNRAQLKTDGSVLGFVSRESNELAPIQDCLVLNDHNRKTLKELLKMLPNSAWKPKDLPQKKEDIRWNFLDIDDEIASHEVILNKRRPFRQGNSEQNKKILSWLQNHLSSKDKFSAVTELFCGSGNFTKIISELGFTYIHGYEASEQAIAQLNNLKLKHTTGSVADLFKPREVRRIARENSSASILVLDPPREGFALINDLTRSLISLKEIYYISCDAISFARDCKSLEDQGWRLQEIQPVDMFPNTPHLEILGRIIKQA